MMKKLRHGFLALLSVLASGPFALAQDPFAFQFGYSLAFQNSFRNRLPTPPYFSIYPPVYYGQRFARPYGESPYASWPLLQPAPGYHAVPMEGHFVRPSVLVNPHIPGVTPELPKMKVSDDAGNAPFVSYPVPKDPIVIVNPFVAPRWGRLVNKD